MLRRSLEMKNTSTSFNNRNRCRLRNLSELCFLFHLKNKSDRSDKLMNELIAVNFIIVNSDKEVCKFT